MQRGSGNCLAVALMKFFVLEAADEAGLRLAYTIHVRGATPGLRRPHLVVLVGLPPAESRVLDSLNPFVLPLSLRPDLRPVFSFDRRWIWRGIDALPDRPAQRLLPWQRLLDRWDPAPAAPQSMASMSTTRPVRGLTSQR